MSIIKVKVRLQQTSQSIEIDAKNTYQKGDFFCIYTVENKVRKFPISTIFEIEEDYSNE